MNENTMPAIGGSASGGKHYICTGGCGAVSDKPGICQDAGCLNHFHTFIECNCTDGQHAGMMTACKNCGKLCKLEGGCAVEPFREEIEE